MDTNATGQGHDTDRVTVAEAADRLGVTHDAVRARIRRGTLEGEKEGGNWFVFLPRDAQPDTDATATGADTTDDSALIEQLQSEVAYLRGELTAAREQAAEERRRADIIQLRYMDALPPKTQDAPSDAPESPRSDVTPEHGSTHGHDDDTTPVHGLSRLWRWLRG